MKTGLIHIKRANGLLVSIFPSETRKWPFTFWFCHCQSNRINKDSRAFVGRGREQQRYERTYAAGQSQLIPLE
jgi:hypothetical protein